MAYGNRFSPFRWVTVFQKSFRLKKGDWRVNLPPVKNDEIQLRRRLNPNFIREWAARAPKHVG
jgi:hypothetical protein